MGRIYSVPIAVSAVTNIQDFFEITAPSDALVIVHEVFIGQDSDAGDSQAEMLRVQIRRVSASGSSGTSVTPHPHAVGSPAYGGTCEANNTTIASRSGETILQERGFNVQVGFQYLPSPEERIEISPGGILCFTLPVAPSDPLDMFGTAVIEEIGG